MCTFASSADLADPATVLPDDAAFAVTTSCDGERYRVRVAGELDIATRDLVHRACIAGQHMAVTVDMAETTFMDCSGYGGLVAARRDLERRGGSMTLHGPAGQPAELLALLAVSEGEAFVP
ncbi:MAG: STAS domain-containing protein [Ilumatobacteraceae bacterium]